MKIDAYAEKRRRQNVIQRVSRTRAITGYLLAITLLLSGFKAVSESATRQDLQREIEALTASTKNDVKQDVQVINAIHAALAPPLSLTAGTVSGEPGMAVDVPVYLKAGSAPVSGVQFDVSGPPGIEITGADEGVAARAADKSVSAAPVTNGQRVIVFGLNQDAVPSGEVVVLKVMVAGGAIAGNKVVSITSVTGSSPDGNSVVLTSKNGSVQVE